MRVKMRKSKDYMNGYIAGMKDAEDVVMQAILLAKKSKREALKK